MKKPLALLIAAFISLSLLPVNQPKLSEAALTAKIIGIDGEETSLRDILAQFPNQEIFIDLWASWCKDCIVGFPKIHDYQEKYDELVFLYLSVDKKDNEWKNGIERFNLSGEHFRMDRGWDNEFCEAIDLDWIPRYMILDSEGNIIHFKSIVANDKSLAKVMKSYR
ncbi:MAG: thiol-disulfide isomerase/thioredoxin [Cyclobacteriaceae bacterium]|jgi:thiol-disulfide isomerase/thioredoxin